MTAGLALDHLGLHDDDRTRERVDGRVVDLLREPEHLTHAHREPLRQLRVLDRLAGEDAARNHA